MRLKATDKEAENVKAVYLDNKLCLMVTELDTTEGWVEMLVPDLPKEEVEGLLPEDLNEDGDPEGYFNYKVNKVFGEVRVVFDQEDNNAEQNKER